MKRPENGWKYAELTHRDYAEIVARRFCLRLEFAEKVLKDLDSIPIQAFRKLAEKGDEGTMQYIGSRYLS